MLGTGYLILVAVLSLGHVIDGTYYIERYIDLKASNQREQAPYYAKDFFRNPAGCSFLTYKVCTKYSATCEGLFTCCYCQCGRKATFTSLSSGCKEGEEYRSAMAKTGVDCKFVSVAMPGDIPAYKAANELRAGLAFTFPQDNVGGIDLRASSTSCSALRLFYINKNGNERLITDNTCSGIFTTVFDAISRRWMIKWKSDDSKVWASLEGKLLKFEIKCINETTHDTFISCIHAKVSGKYNDDIPLIVHRDTSCPKTVTTPTPTPIPTQSTIPSTNVSVPYKRPEKSSSMVPMIGGAIGAILVIIIIIILICVIRRRKASESARNLDVRYERPIIDDVDSNSRRSTEPRYHMDRALPKKPDDPDDSEYAVIGETLSNHVPDYATADDLGKGRSFKKEQPEYQESTNPYYRPASCDAYGANMEDSKERQNTAYEPSFPTSSCNLYDDPNSNLRPIPPVEYEDPAALSLPSSTTQENVPLYQSADEYEDMTKSLKV